MSITKEFLETALGKTIYAFVVSAGTRPGENYLSDMFCVDVELDSQIGGNTLHLMCKCFPTEEEATGIVTFSNLFWNEVNTYKKFFPALKQLLEDEKLLVNLPFPEFISGEAVDFKNARELTESDKGFPENYVLMQNVRKSSDFTLANCGAFDSAHVLIVLKQLAKLHSLSWAYKEIHGLESLITEFRSLEFKVRADWSHLIRTELIPKYVRNFPVDWEDFEALKEGTMKFQGIVEEMIEIAFEGNPAGGKSEREFEKFMRIRPPTEENEVPWRVAIHGDCWGMNLMFRYDSSGKVPVDGIIVDFQLMRERCPTLDLAYFIYTTTLVETRKEFLDSWLAIYFEECLRYFQMLKVQPIPAFSLSELRRRYNRSKVFAYFMLLVEFPNKFDISKEMYRDGVI